MVNCGKQTRNLMRRQPTAKQEEPGTTGQVSPSAMCNIDSFGSTGTRLRGRGYRAVGCHCLCGKHMHVNENSALKRYLSSIARHDIFDIVLYSCTKRKFLNQRISNCMTDT